MNLEIKNRFKSLISKDLMRILLYSTMCSENKDGRPCENDRTKKLLDVNICSYMFQKCKIFQHSNSSSIQQTLRTLYQILLLLILLTVPCSCAHSWESPGCHRVGNTRPVQIPGCVVFNVTLNACRGYCESFAIPSPSLTLVVNPNHEITSRAECCSMKETHDVKVLVRCVTGIREVVFKSARSCACSICRK